MRKTKNQKRISLIKQYNLILWEYLNYKHLNRRKLISFKLFYIKRNTNLKLKANRPPLKHHRYNSLIIPLKGTDNSYENKFIARKLLYIPDLARIPVANLSKQTVLRNTNLITTIELKELQRNNCNKKLGLQILFGHLSNRIVENLLIKMKNFRLPSNLFCVLEARLDNYVFKTKIVRTIIEARRLIMCGCVFVNNKNTRSYHLIIKPGDYLIIQPHKQQLFSQMQTVLQERFTKKLQRFLWPTNPTYAFPFFVSEITQLNYIAIANNNSFDITRYETIKTRCR